MKYLLTKLRRDVTRLWSQFISVFLMALLCLMIFSGMEGVWNGLRIASDAYFSETNLCDVWVYGNNIDDKVFNDILTLEAVKEASRSMTVTVNAASIATGDIAPDIKIITINNQETIKPKLMDGVPFSTEEKGIWLDQSFANAHGLKVGDTIKLSYSELNCGMVIQGLILESEFIYYTGSATETIPDASRHSYAIISEKQAEAFFQMLFYNEMRVNLNDGYSINQFEIDAKGILGDRYYGIIERENLTSVSQISKEINQMQSMAGLFSLVFILLALLTMYTTMSRLVNSQMIQIGTLKALGFSNRKIRFHYALYGFVIVLLGGLAGSVVGRLAIATSVITMKQTVLTLPQWNASVSILTYIIIVLLALICAISAILAANRSLRGMPAQTMRGVTKDEPQQVSIASTEPADMTKKSSYKWNWVFRDISRNKIRYIMGVIGVAGSIMLMICGLGLKDSIAYSNSYVYDKQYSYDYKAVLSSLDENAYAGIESKAVSYQWLEEAGVDIEFGDIKKTGAFTVVGEGDFILFENMSGEKINLPDKGIVITHKIATLLNVSKGDSIRFHIIGTSESLEGEITEILMTPTPQGIFLSKKAWLSYHKPFRPTSILLGSDSYNAISQTGYFKEMTSITKQAENMDEMANSVHSIIMLLIVASLVLSIVILYNLGMLNFIERSREYATMKVLGFFQKEIRSLIIRDWIVTLIPGVIIGVPVGYAFLNMYIKTVSFTSYEWIARLEPASLAIILVIISICSFLVNLFVGSKVKRIDMVEALKSID